MVRPERLRFDFSVREAPTADELRQVEELVNRRIVENHAVRPFVTTREYAAEIGALAFFEEKYGEFVRVLEIDDFSRELCGGTHVSSTSQIGLFKITASQSVGANTRRIEAITSAAAIEHYRGLEDAWDGLAADARRQAGPRARRGRASSRRRSRELQKKLKAAESGERRDLAGELLAAARSRSAAWPWWPRRRRWTTADELLALADEVRERRPDCRRAARGRGRRPRGGRGRGRRRGRGPRRARAGDVLQRHAARRRRQGRRQAEPGARRRRQGRRHRRGPRRRRSPRVARAARVA